MSDSDMAYIGISPCGHVNAAIVDKPGHEKEVASFVASLIRRGMSVEHGTVGDLRPRIDLCDCDRKAKEEAKAAAKTAKQKALL